MAFAESSRITVCFAQMSRCSTADRTFRWTDQRAKRPSREQGVFEDGWHFQQRNQIIYSDARVEENDSHRDDVVFYRPGRFMSNISASPLSYAFELS
jgi:hypothetical protein